MEARILRTFEDLLIAADGQPFRVRIAGRRSPEGNRWEGWVEFYPDGGGPVLRSGRETVQASLRGLDTWARGLRRVYLEGSLERTLERHGARLIAGTTGAISDRPRFDGPAPDLRDGVRPAPDDVALNPVLHYRDSETELRGRMAELSTGELRAIALAYHFDRGGRFDVPSLDRGSLLELIVASARARAS